MTNHHTDPDATPTSQDPFWSDDADWTPSALERTTSHATVGVGANVTRWWGSLLGGDAPAGRSHGESAPRPHRSGGGRADTGAAPGSWQLAPSTRGVVGGGGLDPKVARLGALVIAITVAVPLILGFTSSSDDDTLKTADAVTTTTVAPITTQTIAVGDQVQLPADPSATPTEQTRADDAETSAGASPATSADTTASGASAQSTGVQASPPAESSSTSTSSSSTSSSTSTSSDGGDDATASGVASATESSSCGNTYEVAAGDYWIRIADAAGVSLSDLLDVNNASSSTELQPGDSICLPAGASTPAPPPAPTTAQPTTTARPTTTNAPTTTSRPTTTNAPTTTSRPTTTSPPSSSSSVEEIIRSVWPDELEERALTIAWRESRHQPDAYNGHCCYGLFQMYYTVHRSWLTAYGVYSASDLYDPWKNARAAYGLYQRAGGWGPWSQTNY